MAERWSTETEDLLARSLAWIGPPDQQDRGNARAVLDVLADAGVLVPPDAPKRYEWASEHVGELGTADNRLFQPVGSGRAGERLARIRVDTWRKDRPDVVSKVLRRADRTVYGEWEEVDE